MTSRRGFTFVELLVSMVLLGTLSAMAVPRYRQYKVRAYLAAMKSDLSNLRIAEELVWAEQQRYTTDTAALDVRQSSDVVIEISSEDPIAGYTALATHRLSPGIQCVTATGREALAQESGSILCGPLGGGSGTLKGGNP